MKIEIPSPSPSSQTPPAADDSRRWTVMVFMGVNTEEGNAPLVEAARADLAEMAKGVAAGSGPGPGARLNVFAQVHGEGEPWRYHIGHDNGRPVPKNQQDVGDGQALMHFIIDSLGAVGTGRITTVRCWSCGATRTTSRSERQRRAPARSTRSISASSRKYWSRCRSRPAGPSAFPIHGSTSSPSTRATSRPWSSPVSSMATPTTSSDRRLACPFRGGRTDRVLERLQDPQGRLMGAAELGSWIVRRFCEAYTSRRSVSLSLLDLKRAPELFARAKVLAMVLNDAIERDIDFLDALTDLFSRSLTAEDKPYVDVADLCLNLRREVSDPLVNEAARALGDFLITPSDNVVKNSPTGEGWPFVAAFGRNAGETAKLNGISLYAPHVAPANDFVAVRALYDNFDFARDTQWSELVHTLAQHAELELEAEESI